jgi:hypothetical protein
MALIMTRQQAHNRKLLTCKCGHHEDSHQPKKKANHTPCKICRCPHYDEVTKDGTFIVQSKT